MTDHVLVEKSDKVLTLTLNRPEKKNALTVAMYRQLAAQLAQADQDPEVRCILIQAHGDMFTAGNDLADFATFNGAADSSAERLSNPFIEALGSLGTPLVAAVNGRAVGIGVTLLLHCDMVFVAENTVLVAPFVNLALVPEAASSLLMPLRIGHARAFEMFVLGEPVSAAQAVSWGIANHAVPLADVQSRARSAAVAIAARAPAAVLTTKALMRDQVQMAARIAEEGVHFGRQLKSAEFKEAFAAFAERRPPDFGKFT
jgi:enoyl-CoA hydratase/carnithine racemase